VSEALLIARGLHKAYGANLVTSDLSFEVHQGETLAILGLNGAGKTTLFNLISGDVACDKGTLHFNGRLLRSERPFERCRLGIGRTYQIPRPYVGMSVFENLLVAAMFGGRMKEQAAGNFCAEVLDQCGLMAKANVLAGELSLLDRKRLELARALASQPKLLLLDEIAGGLTDEEADKLVHLVLEIKRQGATVVWIEHVLRAVMAVADRVMVLNFGAKLTEGTPQAVMADKEVQRVYMGIEA
jgi:branched-chain amino acid transport system ATP-binding protein